MKLAIINSSRIAASYYANSLANNWNKSFNKFKAYLKSLVIFLFSLLTNWVLHHLASHVLLPFRFAWWVSSYVLALGSSRWNPKIRSSQSLSMSYHAAKGAIIFATVSPDVIVFCFLWATSSSGCIALLLIILTLALDIDRGLWSYSIFGGGWAWFLWIGAFASHGLHTVASYQIIVLLD